MVSVLTMVDAFVTFNPQRHVRKVVVRQEAKKKVVDVPKVVKHALVALESTPLDVWMTMNFLGWITCVGLVVHWFFVAHGVTELSTRIGYVAQLLTWAGYIGIRHVPDAKRSIAKRLALAQEVSCYFGIWGRPSVADDVAAFLLDDDDDEKEEIDMFVVTDVGRSDKDGNVELFEPILEAHPGLFVTTWEGSGQRYNETLKRELAIVLGVPNLSLHEMGRHIAEITKSRAFFGGGPSSMALVVDVFSKDVTKDEVTKVLNDAAILKASAGPALDVVISVPNYSQLPRHLPSKIRLDRETRKNRDRLAAMPIFLRQTNRIENFHHDDLDYIADICNAILASKDPPDDVLRQLMPQIHSDYIATPRDTDAQIHAAQRRALEKYACLGFVKREILDVLTTELLADLENALLPSRNRK